MDEKGNINLGLNDMRDGQIIPYVGTVLSNLKEHFAAEFANCPENASLDGLEKVHGNFAVSYQASLNRGRIEIAQKNSVKRELSKRFTCTGKYFEVVTDHDLGKLLMSGFRLRRTKSGGATGSASSAPGNPAVKQGDLIGTVIASCSAVIGAGSYEFWYTTGDPKVEADWKYLKVSKGCKGVVLEGLTPGTVYFFRVRAVVSNGYTPWSSPVHIMVT